MDYTGLFNDYDSSLSERIFLFSHHATLSRDPSCHFEWRSDWEYNPISLSSSISLMMMKVLLGTHRLMSVQSVIDQ
jgi:hypothetical protein